MEGEISRGTLGRKSQRNLKICLLIYYYFIVFISSSDNEIVERYSPIVHGSHWLLHPVPGVQRLRLESRVVHVSKHCHLLLSPDDDLEGTDLWLWLICNWGGLSKLITTTQQCWCSSLDISPSCDSLTCKLANKDELKYLIFQKYFLKCLNSIELLFLVYLVS